jgi:hypothetical protein
LRHQRIVGSTSERLRAGTFLPAGGDKATLSIPGSGDTAVLAAGSPGGVGRAVRAPPPREPVAQYATGEELAKLLLCEATEAVSVAAVRDFPEKELEVRADDGVEHGVLRVAGLIRAIVVAHTHG